MRSCAECGELKRCSRNRGRYLCAKDDHNERFPPDEQCPCCPRRCRVDRYANGQRMCWRCARLRQPKKRGRCSECGRETALYGGRCEPHARAYRWAGYSQRNCRRCRRYRHVDRRGHCEPCARQVSYEGSVARKLRAFFTDAALLRPTVRALYAHLTADRDPANILAWLRNAHPDVLAYLARIGGGESPERSVLDGLIAVPGGAMLLSSCERAAIVSPPLPRIAELEAKLPRLFNVLSKPSALLMQTYWRLCICKAITTRFQCRTLPSAALHTDWTYLTVASDFLQFLDQRGIELARLDQAALDKWLAQRSRWKGDYLRRFLACPEIAQKLACHLSIAPLPPSQAPGVDDDTYFGTLDRARRDRRLPLMVRVAVILVTVCGKTVSELVQLRVSDVMRGERGQIDVRFSKGVPQPLFGQDAQLVLRLAQSTRQWLFPTPTGQPYAAQSLRVRIHAAGVDADLTLLCNTARRQFLRDIEPGDLVRILGFTITVADVWAKRIGVA